MQSGLRHDRRIHPGSGRRRGPDYPKGRQVDPAALAEVQALLGDRDRRPDLLIEHLHLLQDHVGCLHARHLAALALIAALGPAIGPDRYQVGDEVAEAVRESFGERATVALRPDGTGRWLLDMWAVNRLVLSRAGALGHRPRRRRGGRSGRRRAGRARGRGDRLTLLGAALALLSAASWGTGDFCGGLAGLRVLDLACCCCCWPWPAPCSSSAGSITSPPAPPPRKPPMRAKARKPPPHPSPDTAWARSSAT